MTLTLLSATQVAWIFGLAALFATGLYLLKVRRRTRPVPFSPLWLKAAGEQDARRLFGPLNRAGSLAVQLALLALLALALGGPVLGHWATNEARNVVVLIDASASMQATEGATTRLALAKEAARKLVQSLGPEDRMLVAQMDATTTALVPMSHDTNELLRAVDAVQATDARADFAAALRFSMDSLDGLKDALIVVVSDGCLGQAVDATGPVHLGKDVKLTYLPIGSETENVGITSFAVRRYPLEKNRYEVMLEVVNSGTKPADVELTLLGDGAVVDVAKVHLAPAERWPRFYANLSGADRKLEARLAPVDGTRDALGVDDRAYALLPPRRRVKVLVVSAGNTYLEAALLLDEYLDVHVVTPALYAAGTEGDASTYDVVFFDNVTPVVQPKAHALYLNPSGEAAPVKVANVVRRPGFDKVERKHPIVRWSALDDVNIAEGRKLLPDARDTVVGASEQGAILVAGQRAEYKFVAVGFDPRDSDWPLRVAWPLFLMNTIQWFMTDSSAYVPPYRTGEIWRIPVNFASSEASLEPTLGGPVVVPVHDGHAVYLGRRAGFYGLTPLPPPREATAPLTIAASMLDAEEGAIAPRQTLVVDGRTAEPFSPGSTGGARRELWIYLVLAALGITFLEWATYHRRVTV